jgi:hypothetical protein
MTTLLAVVPPPNSTDTIATTTTTTTSTEEEEEPSSSSACHFVETAWEWFERCELLRRQERHGILPDEPPTSSTAAAYAFFRGSSCLYGGTGNPFVDEAFSSLPTTRQLPWKQPLPLLEIKNRHGSHRTGKTHSLVSLAAKFVVSTRSSLFVPQQQVPPSTTKAAASRRMPGTIHKQQQQQKLPQVVLLDSEWDITFLRVAHAVSSQLMLHSTGPSLEQGNTESNHPVTTTTTNDTMNTTTTTTTTTPNHPLLDTERDMEDCLSRIHIAHVDDDREWIPILEALRHELGTPKQQHDLDDDDDDGMITKDDPLVVRGDEQDKEDDDFPPTLLLWDGFLGNNNNTGRRNNHEGLEKEISRQLALLLQDCNIGFICTTTGNRGASTRTESRHVQLRDLLQDKSCSMGAVQRNRHPQSPLMARTVVLERDERLESPHGFLATVVEGNQQIPYSLSSAGVLP